MKKYLTFDEISGVPLTLEHIGWYREFIEDYKEIGGGDWYLIPADSENIYKIKYLHQLQNVLSFHGHDLQNIQSVGAIPLPTDPGTSSLFWDLWG